MNGAEQLHRLKRISDLLKVAKTGKAPDEIYDEVETLDSNIDDWNGRQRGRESEQRTAEALRTLSYVANVQQINRETYQDLKGHDLHIQFKMGEIDFPFDTVFVQVKSADRSIDNFKRDLSNYLQRTSSPYNANSWLCKHRLIVLNGQTPRVKIIDQFSVQLGAIDRYHKLRQNNRRVW